MIRLHILAEGQTEETTVRHVLAPHLGAFDISADVRCVETSRTATRYARGGAVAGRIYRGGLLDYDRAKRDLVRWMKEDSNPDCIFTTMFDVYALPQDFPGYSEAAAESDPYRRVARLEAALSEDLADSRFIPYLQLHEFEALILADPLKLDWLFIEHEAAIQRLVTLAQSFPNPELINDGVATSPSKRIIREIPAYEEQKRIAGPVVVGKIGIAALRERCPHFREWLEKLEGLGHPAPTEPHAR